MTACQTRSPEPSTCASTGEVAGAFRYLDIAITTLTAVRNLVKGRGGVTLSALEGNTPRWAIMESVSCSESWNPPISSSRYFFW